MREFQTEGTEHSRPRLTEPDMFPEPYPWCLSCGFQHEDDEHCPECTGDHSTGTCMTAELAHELGAVDELRRRVELAVGPLLHEAAMGFLRNRTGVK